MSLAVFVKKIKIILYLLKILKAIYFYIENNDKNLSQKNYYVYRLVLRAKKQDI